LLLYNTALDVRYSGFLNPKTRNEYLQKKFKKSYKALKLIDSYMKSQGYSSLIPIQEESDFNDSEK
jgi:hypothetical protein